MIAARMINIPTSLPKHPDYIAELSQTHFAKLFHDAFNRKWQTLRATLRRHIDALAQTSSEVCINK